MYTCTFLGLGSLIKRIVTNNMGTAKAKTPGPKAIELQWMASEVCIGPI